MSVDSLTRVVRIALALLAAGGVAAGHGLLAGYARRDITPREPTPMWGYGDRHGALSEGVRDPLYADALVLQAGQNKFALVGLDLGRSPNETSLQAIRKRILDKAGIAHSIHAGSHTHHGPVMELKDEPGKGKGTFDAALRYYRQMEEAVADALVEANNRLQPVRLAAGSVLVGNLNRNRHTKKDPKPVDRELVVLRLEGRNGEPVATVVNFTAHPTSLPSSDHRFSADYVGALKDFVARETGAGVVFLQGAEGDQSTNRGALDYRGYGERLGAEAVTLAKSLVPRAAVPASLEVREERFRFESRISHGEVPRKLHPNQEAEQRRWMMIHQDMLDEGKIENLVHALRSLDFSTPTLAEEIRKKADYFEKNAERMRYPEFRRQHLFVGTGVLEAGCKTVIGSRCKQSGMFWTVRGANDILALRCCQMNGKFEDYWEARRA